MAEEYNVSTENYTAKQKIANFWYHYKWHSIVALFLVIVILVCSLQFCSNTDYDAYIMYAGGYAFTRTSKDGDIPTYVGAANSFKRVCKDVTGDGEVNVSLADLLYMTEEEAMAYREKYGTDPDTKLLYDDMQRMDNMMSASDYFILLISPTVYDRYYKEGDTPRFESIAQYTTEGIEYDYYSEYAIRLSSLAFYELPYISSLPEDTLVCFRRIGVFGKNSGVKKKYEISQDVLRSLLAYQ